MTSKVRGVDNMDSAQQGQILFSSQDLNSDGIGRVINVGLPDDWYRVEWDIAVRPPNDAVNLLMRCGNGSIDTGSYYQRAERYQEISTGTPNNGTAVSGTTSQIKIFNSMGNGSAEYVSGRITVFKLHFSNRPMFRSELHGINSSSALYRVDTYAQYFNGQIDTLQLYHGGGTNSWDANSYMQVRAYTLPSTLYQGTATW